MGRPIALFSARRGTVGLIVFLGLGLSALIWHYAVRKEQEKIHAEFLRRAQAQASLAHERLLIYEEMVYSVRGAFVGQKEVNRQEFYHVAREILARHAGVQALAWVQIVKDNERAALEETASRELGRPFALKNALRPVAFVLAPRAEEYFALLYIEPLAGNEAALGYDLTSAPSAKEAEAARREKRLVVSHPIRLAQSTSPSDETGVVFMLPVF